MEKERLAIKMQRHLRPLTAAPKKFMKRSRKDLRPTTASTMRSHDSTTMARQSLGKSHLEASGRTENPEVTHEVTQDDSTLDLTPMHDSEIELELITIVGAQNDHVDAEWPASPVPLDPPKLRHPSFETWIQGSPHSSEEYDTDVGEDVVEDSVLSSHASDATGRLEYEEQCRKHGFVPISYLLRHIGERNVRMRHRCLGGSATKPLALAFKHNTVTENLDLTDNHIEGTGTSYIASMLRENHFIVSLNLSNNAIGSEGSEAIGEMLEVNTTLKMLSLAGNQLGDRDAYHLINPLKNNVSLISLDLSHNEFSVMGGIHLGGALGVNEGLTEVDLSWNCLRKHGAVAIANCLKLNTSLEVLDMSWNGFGLEGATALQKSLQVNTTLKVLDLTNNRMDVKSAQKLAVGLKKNSGLETLILSMNPLADAGVELILKAVAHHPTLRLLALENCAELGLTKANTALIREIEANTDMVVIHSGTGGFNRNSAMSNVLRLFTGFLKKHKGELHDLFKQQDKDGTGRLQVDDVKVCLRTAGLNLTSKYLSLLVDDMDTTHSGELNYRDILSGAAFSEHSRRRPSRGFQLLSKAKLESDSEDA